MKDDQPRSLRPWIRSLRSASQRADPQAILSRDDSAAAVAELTELEAYHLVKQLGIGEAPIVLGYLQPQQIQTLFDLDAWRGPEFDAEDALLWFASFGAAGLEAMHKARQSLDPETMALLFRRRLYVGLAPRDQDSDPPPVPEWMANPPPEIEPLVRTPDGRFIIAARTHEETSGHLIDEESRKSILQVVDDLYRDPRWEEVASALRQAESDLSTMLEEEGGRFRQGRLEDLGFVPLRRALEVYGPLDPQTLLNAKTPDKAPTLQERLPANYHAALLDGLFAAAADSLEDESDVARLEGDLLPVMNAVLVADGVEPADLEGVRASLTAARGRMEVALAYQTEPADRLSIAAERLKAHHPQDLLRVGHTLILRTASRAKEEKLAWAEKGVALDDPRAALLEALSGRRPQVIESLDAVSDALTAGGDPIGILGPDGQEERRPFSRVGDLEAVGRVVDQLTALRTWSGSRPLSASPALPPVAERNVALVVKSRGANALLGRDLEAPLDAEAIAELAERAAIHAASATTPGFGEADLAKVQAALSPPELVWPEVRFWLTELAHDLFGLVGAEVDLRFVGGLLLVIPGGID